MRKGVLATLFLLGCLAVGAQQTLNNDSIVKMTKAGLSDDVIVSTVNATAGKYDISADSLIALKEAGVGDKVISAIVAKASADASSQPAATSAAQPPAGAATTPTNRDSQQEEGTSHGSASVPTGARIVIAPMGGFETYFAAAVREKRVPITLTLDKDSAQYFVVSTDTEWRGFVYGSGASWNPAGGAAGASASSTRGLEASIMLIDARSKDVVWAYEVHKNSHGSILFGTLGARGEQSVAEACAKHLKEYIEKGR
jgi:hypothetical protein